MFKCEICGKTYTLLEERINCETNCFNKMITEKTLLEKEEKIRQQNERKIHLQNHLKELSNEIEQLGIEIEQKGKEIDNKSKEYEKALHEFKKEFPCADNLNPDTSICTDNSGLDTIMSALHILFNC